MTENNILLVDRLKCACVDLERLSCSDLKQQKSIYDCLQDAIQVLRKNCKETRGLDEIFNFCAACDSVVDEPAHCNKNCEKIDWFDAFECIYDEPFTSWCLSAKYPGSRSAYIETADYGMFINPLYDSKSAKIYFFQYWQGDPTLALSFSLKNAQADMLKSIKIDEKPEKIDMKDWIFVLGFYKKK